MACPCIHVYIKLNSGRTTSLQLLPEEKVSRIYEHVAQEEGVPVGRIQIKYTGKVLQKKYTVGYLGIREETVLKAEVITERDWLVMVRLPTNDVLSFTVKNTCSVQEIKNRVEAKEGILPPNQILKLNSGVVLSCNAQPLWEAGVTNETVLNLVEKPAVEGKKEKQDEEVVIEDDDKRQELLTTFDAAGRNVDIVFSFDTTGSMYSCLSEVRQQVKKTVERLLNDIPNIRIGIIVHGDYCDYGNYVIKIKDLTSDTENLTSFVMDVPSTGGGDTPECYEWVLKKAQQLDWRENSAKALVVIGDALPHPVSYTDQCINWHEELDILGGMDVKVYGVRAQHDTMASAFYEELADRTGGACIKFRQFSLIRDMFLAVCYNESSPEQLQAFCEEVEQAGRMTEDTKEMFTQLEQMTEHNKDNKNKENRPMRYIADSWWDPSLDHGSPKYTYNANSDKWSPYGCSSSSEAVELFPISVDTNSTKKKKMTRFRFFSCFSREH